MLGQGAMLVGAGTVVGMTAALAASRVLETMLYGVATDDALTFLMAPPALATSGLVACWLPALAGKEHRPNESASVRVGSPPPFTGPGLGLRDLLGRHDLAQNIEPAAADARAGGSQGHPHVRRNEVLLHALPGHVHHPQGSL